MLTSRTIVILVLIACLIVLAWLALDHLLFPDLPVPAGVAPIAK